MALPAFSTAIVIETTSDASSEAAATPRAPIESNRIELLYIRFDHIESNLYLSSIRSNIRGFDSIFDLIEFP